MRPIDEVEKEHWIVERSISKAERGVDVLDSSTVTKESTCLSDRIIKCKSLDSLNNQFLVKINPRQPSICERVLLSSIALQYRSTMLS